jgi:hypothetical protein
MKILDRKVLKKLYESFFKNNKKNVSKNFVMKKSRKQCIREKCFEKKKRKRKKQKTESPWHRIRWQPGMLRPPLSACEVAMGGLKL